jgi:hypothetical protein
MDDPIAIFRVSFVQMHVILVIGISEYIWGGENELTQPLHPSFGITIPIFRLVASFSYLSTKELCDLKT